VNPSLWRQGRLNNVAGLFEVTAGVYQVRGLDISNITYLEGETGWIVIDPLTATETARAAHDVVARHFGERPVHAVIYTHSHTDHFGGIHGVIDVADVKAGRVEILAPEGFVEAAVSEQRLGRHADAATRDLHVRLADPQGREGPRRHRPRKGLPALPAVGFVAPTREISSTGTEATIDGLTMVFQVTPGTEAPAEMNIYLPQRRALCMAETCTANMHNLYTLRGAQVRDALRVEQVHQRSHHALRRRD
jgi:alkyl sulfatase BDS1-like metallo-beta-lactamase superfamily hydrolase